ncbi:MAG TPA: hypothetical protein VGA52_02480 [Anaerolineales bacterium]|jgi:hypothetical protein
MNIDNQLILGIVFITAGIAMALLAYAAFLNRQGAAEDEDTSLGDQAEPAEDALQTTAAAEQATDIPTPPEGTGEPEEAARPQGEPAALPPTVKPADAPAIPTPMASPSTASAVLVRDPETGRLSVRVGDTTYRSFEALRESQDWSDVSTLFSDVLAWLVKTAPAQAELAKEKARPLSQAGSMVEQINTILSEKTGEGSPVAGVRLTESAGGAIRVVIGVKSYPMEEVPDDQVRQLIQWAVSEWESRQ